MISDYMTEMFSNPVNIILAVVCIFLLLRILKSDQPEEIKDKVLELMEKRDFTLQELKKYNGADDERILIGVNGNVYDVSKGRRFYGPGKI